MGEQSQGKIRDSKAQVKNFFILAGIGEAFHMARIARIFPNVATGDKIKYSTHNESRVVQLNCTT